MRDKDIESQLEDLFSDAAVPPSQPDGAREATAGGRPAGRPYEVGSEGEESDHEGHPYEVGGEGGGRSGDLLSAVDVEPDTDRGLREELLLKLVAGQTVGVAFLTVVTAIGGLLVPGSHLLGLLPLGVVGVVVGLVSRWLLRRGRFRPAGYVFTLGTSVAITVVVFLRGYQDASPLYYLWPILGAVLMLEGGGGALVTLVSTIFYLGLVAVQGLGYQSLLLPYDPQGEVFLTVASRVMMFFLLAFLAWLSGRNLDRAVEKVREAARGWQELSESLEQRVQERTGTLNRQAAQLQAAMEVSHLASSVLDPDTLMRQTVNLIQSRFGYYYAGLFLLDVSERWAVLRAGTGQAGGEMLARGHRLEVGGESMVGWCMAHERARIALDVGQEAIRFENPLLPRTRSEMALPLVARGRVIGALSVQSAEQRAFSEKDVAVLQTMADQVANAIENTRLLQEMEHLTRRSQLTSEISGKLRSAIGLEGVLETTVRQLGLTLGASEAVIRLGVPGRSAGARGEDEEALV